MSGERRAGSAASDPRALPFAIFLELERAARAAATREELGYLIVNETRRLAAFRTAALLRFPSPSRARLAAATNVSTPDRHGPFALFMERLAQGLVRAGSDARSHAVSREGLAPEDSALWSEVAPAHLLWTPLRHRGITTGGIVYGRETPFSAAEALLLDQIADAYAHADAALAGRGRRIGRARGPRRWLLPALVAGMLASLALPVRQAALAPAEVVGADPLIVAAPADGVLESVAVAPGERVAQGDILFRLDDTNARARRDIAERAVAVAEAELRRAAQSAFGDREASAQIDALRAQVALKRAEYVHASEILERGVVRAARDGVVVMADPSGWTGRPVRTGERVMEIVDLHRPELRAEVPVGQVFAFDHGARVTLFLDTSPLEPLEARLVRMSYEAEPTEAGVLAHRAVARFETAQAPRIGARGTARIEGPRVPLALFLFGRPISAARQFLGL